MYVCMYVCMYECMILLRHFYSVQSSIERHFYSVSPFTRCPNQPIYRDTFTASHHLQDAPISLSIETLLQRLTIYKMPQSDLCFLSLLLVPLLPGLGCTPLFLLGTENQKRTRRHEEKHHSQPAIDLSSIWPLLLLLPTSASAAAGVRSGAAGGSAVAAAVAAGIAVPALLPVAAAVGSVAAGGSAVAAAVAAGIAAPAVLLVAASVAGAVVAVAPTGSAGSRRWPCTGAPSHWIAWPAPAPFGSARRLFSC